MFHRNGQFKHFQSLLSEALAPNWRRWHRAVTERAQVVERGAVEERHVRSHCRLRWNSRCVGTVLEALEETQQTAVYSSENDSSIDPQHANLEHSCDPAEAF